MFDYITGIIFIPLFIWFVSAFGKKIRKSNLFSENLIYGFVFYTCLQFIGGFTSQMLHLPWIIYQSYMILLIIAILIFTIYKHEKINLKNVFVKHIKKYWLIYTIAAIFVILSCLNLQYQWNANNVDDGYYLLKIKMAPYVDNYADFNYAVGFHSPNSIIRNLNTFEIEAAFYSQILGMDASIYAKVFLAYFNYVLILHTIYWFYKKVMKDSGVRRVIIAIIPLLFFGIYQELMYNFHVLYLQDSWQFNTAMWYGSALVRCMGLFLLITPFIDKEKPDKNSIIFFICSCIALFSKATQTLPLAFVVCVILGGYYILKNLKKKSIGLVLVMLYIVISVLLPISGPLETRAFVIMQQFNNNVSTLIVKLSIFLLIVSYLFDITNLRKWNNWMILIGIIMFVPRLNTPFLIISVYDFVAARTVALYFFALLITAILDVYFILSKILDRRWQMNAIYACIACAFVGVPLISIQRNLGLMNTIKIISKNPMLQPNSTLELGSKLDKIAINKGKTLNVLMPMWVVLDGTPHPVSSMVRYNTLRIYSIGTIPRYNSMDENNPYITYTQDVHVNFEQYHSREVSDDKVMRNLLKSYPDIDCIVVFFDEAKDALVTSFDFKVIEKVPLSDNIHSYYILMRK